MHCMLSICNISHLAFTNECVYAKFPSGGHSDSVKLHLLPPTVTYCCISAPYPHSRCLFHFFAQLNGDYNKIIVNSMRVVAHPETVQHDFPLPRAPTPFPTLQKMRVKSAVVSFIELGALRASPPPVEWLVGS